MKQNRIYGLDIWRSGLLLVGPLIHSAPTVAAALHADPDLYGGMVRASGLFRMPVFFFIAGFLASHAQAKQTEWLKRRIIQLGVPILSTWILLVFPLQYLRMSFFGSFGYSPVHLWFLIDLLVLSCVLSHKFFKSLADAIALKVGPAASLICFFILGGISEAVRYPVVHIPVDVWTLSILQAPSYAIFYMAGMILQRNEVLFQLVRKRWVALSGVVLFAIAFPLIESLQSLLLPHQNRVLKLALAGVSGVVAAGMCCSVMASAIAIKSRPRLVANLSQASYSIYLLHLPVIMVAMPWLTELGAGVEATYIMLVLTSFGVSWMAHELLIKRSAWLLFLFNGSIKHVGSAPGEGLIKRAGA